MKNGRITRFRRVLAKYALGWGVTVLDRHESRPLYRVLGLRTLSHGQGAWDLAYWGSAQPLILDNGRGYPWRRWPWLLHELAHAVSGIHPERCDEIVDTTGFEILSLLHLGLPMTDWEKWQADFMVDETIGNVYATRWHQAPPTWRKKMMIEACDHARRMNLFDGNVPTYSVDR